MSKCRILHYSVPDGPPYYANGPQRVVSRCETHQMEVTGPVDDDTLCIFGRIEQATDVALAKIEKALASMETES